jgi:hypothetical protein
MTFRELLDAPPVCVHGIPAGELCADCDSPEWMPAILADAPADDIAGEPVQLYGPSDMARALDVSPSAVSNYLRRASFQLPPAPFRSPKGTPLWRAADIQSVIAARIAAIESYRDTLAARLGGE